MNRRFLAATLPAMLLAVALAATTTSCSRRSKSPDMARTDQEALMAARAPVNILDRDLRNRVAADIADVQRYPDGRLYVRVTLRNSTRDDLNVLARCVFKDELGLSTGDETEWRQLFLAPQQMVTYGAESRDPGASTFTVEVRRP